MSVLKWMRAGVAMLDPGRDQRVRAAAAEVERRMASDRKAFDLQRTLSSLDVFKEDLPLVVAEAYRSLVRRAWRDSDVTEAERKTLDWAARVLDLPAAQRQQIEGDVGLAAVEQYLAAAVGDGRVDETESAALHAMARQLGRPLPDLLRTYFRDQASGLIRAMFLAAVEDGALLDTEWAGLVRTVTALGLTQEELLQVVRVQAEQFIERALADAKADERITAKEKATLAWLVDHLAPRPETRRYVETEVRRVELIEAIEAGRLPSLRHNGVGMRAGEIVHAACNATYVRTKVLKAGTREESHAGTVTLTDDRLVFQSPTLGLDVNHRRILNLTPYENGFAITASGKGTGQFVTAEADAALFGRMYAVAVRKANQTVVQTSTAPPSRHIPRDVRQRVWQQYGGRCAECGAGDYLEFDHIVPVARGGSSTETNVQLLCRRCNGRKSDAI
jgi:uncharacterized membrane protein YebE (DUF533 family)